jgi:hypothetical protein
MTMNLKATVRRVTDPKGPTETVLVVRDEKGRVVASGPLGFADCARPSPESVTVEDVRRSLRVCGINDFSEAEDIELSVLPDGQRI